jgi:glutaredoxin
MKLTLYTKPDCCLCEEAERTIERVRGDRYFDLEKIDVSNDQALLNEYGELIPVVFIDNRRAFELRVDEKDLRDCLAAATRDPRSSSPVSVS